MRQMELNATKQKGLNVTPQIRKQNLFMLYETYNWLYNRCLEVDNTNSCIEVACMGSQPEVENMRRYYKKATEEAYNKYYYYDFFRMHDWLLIGK